MANLVTLDDAKAWIKRTDSAEDGVFEVMLDQAEAMVLAVAKDIVGDADAKAARVVVVDAWTDDTVPAAIQAAIFAQFAFLERYRGDEAAPAQRGPLCDQAMNYVSRHRDPALA